MFGITLPRPLAAIIGAAVLSTLSIGAAVGPARAAPSNSVDGPSNIAGDRADRIGM